MPLSRSLTKTRPLGVTALSVFLSVATLISIVAAISLTFPNGFLEPIWKLNPRARAGLGLIGIWAVLLFFVVGVACLIAALGLWRGKRWGYFAAIVILCINGLGDLVNALSGTERRALVGIPVVILILAYLMTRRVKLFFSST